MHNKWCRFICLLLSLFLLTLSLTSCSGTSDKQAAPKKPAATDTTGSDDTVNEAFEAYTTWIFDSEIVSNTLNLHYTLANPTDYGIGEYELSLGDYSKKSELSSYSTLENYKAALSDFDLTLFLKRISLPGIFLPIPLTSSWRAGNIICLMNP